jgi:hypothetical protein
MNDTQRYRMNAVECLSAAERCEPSYRGVTIAIAASWLSLARQQEVVDELLAIWSNAQSATPIRPEAFLALCGTSGQMGNCSKSGQQDRKIFMTSGTYNRGNTAVRYRHIAAEYVGLSKGTTDPFLRPYYLRIAEGYTDRANGELQAWERQSNTALAASAGVGG